MKLFVRGLGLLVVAVILGACAPKSAVIKNTPLNPDEHARADVAVAANGVSGEEITLARIQARTPDGGVSDSTHMYDGANTAGEILRTAVGTWGPAAINGYAGYRIAQEKCGSNGCGGGGGGASIAASEAALANRNDIGVNVQIGGCPSGGCSAGDFDLGH